MNNYKFNGFSASLEVDLLEQIKKIVKDEKYLSELNKISLDIEFLGKDSINFISHHAVNTDNKDFNQQLSEAIKAFGQSVKESLSSWSAFTFSPIFEPDQYKYKTEIQDKITIINYQIKGKDYKRFMTNSVTIDSCWISDSSSITKMYLVFDVTPLNKRILKSIRTFYNGYMDIKIDIEYKDFDKIKIPGNIFLSVKYPNSDQHMNFKLNNIVLK
jgi:hypothetical protein